MPSPGGSGGGFGGTGGTSGMSPWAGRDAATFDFAARADSGDDSPDADPASFNCPEVPTAYLLSFADPFTMNEGSAADLLARAGFDVQPLPLDRNPADLQGVIFFGSFVSEHPAYGAYVSQNAVNLYTFVDKANVLVQLSQADQREASPPFLPSTKTARRHDLDLAKLYAFHPDNPLLKDVPVGPIGYLAWQFPQVGWETFASQGGFEVVLAGGTNATNAALMEGAYGQGRIVLAAMAPDKPIGGRAGTRPVQPGVLPQPVHADAATSAAGRRTRWTSPRRRRSRPSAKDRSCWRCCPTRRCIRCCTRASTPRRPAWIASTCPGPAHSLRPAPGRHRRQQHAPGMAAGRAGHVAAGRGGALRAGHGQPRLRTGGQRRHPRHPAEPVLLLRADGRLADLRRRRTRSASWTTPTTCSRAGGRDYIVIALEWGPRDEVIAWADQVMAQNPDALRHPDHPRLPEQQRPPLRPHRHRAPAGVQPAPLRRRRAGSTTASSCGRSWCASTRS